MKKSFAVSVVAAMATAIPLLSSVPAEATVSRDGCWLTALAPTYAGFDAQGYKQYSVTIRAHCDPGRTMAMTTQAWEQDLAGRAGDPDTPDDLLGSWNGTWSNWTAGEVRTWTHKFRMPRNETDGYEELYHRARFYTSQTGSYTPWDYSAVIKAPH
jgi:hypothetical protein